MNLEVIPRKRSVEHESRDNPDIEDAVIVEEPIQIETKDIDPSEETEVEGFETLEEVEKSFSAAKVVFEELSKHSDNLTEITVGKRMIHLFEDNNEQDKNLAKKHKEKYLEHLLLSIDRLKEKKSDDFVLEAEKEEFPPQQSENTTPKIEEEKPEKTQNEDSGEYEKKRAKFLEVKSQYQEKKEVYEGALHDFYSSRDWLDKTGDGVKKFFGISPKLPSPLQFLENEYKASKKDYAEGLNSALLERSKKTYTKTEIKDGAENTVEIKNREYNENSDSTKIAFAEKFILQPHEQLLEIQEDIALSEAQRSRFKGIMRTMNKSKWFTRIGMVTLVGFTGGASAALMFGGRMTVGIMGGMIGAEVARYFTQGAVDESKQQYENKKSSISKDFTIKDLDNLESELLSAQEEKEDAVRNQKLAMFASAFIVGGVASHEAHSVLNSGGIAEGVTTADVESGDAGRFAGSGPETIDMSEESGAFNQIDTNSAEVVPETLDTELLTESAVETLEKYTVKRGDTLWEIMEEKYADKLEGLSEVEKNRVLDTLFDKVRDSNDMKASLNLRSGDDIDIIYTGEKLDLSVLGKELERMADIEKGDDVLPPYVKQGDLPIQATGDDVQKISIKFAEQSAKMTANPEVISGGVVTEEPLSRVTISNHSETVSSIPPPPAGLPPSNYFQHPEFQNEVNKLFGGGKQFNTFLNNEALKVDEKLYSWFDSRNVYPVNPYEFFKVMRIEDIEKLSQDPNVRYQIQEYGMKYDAFLAWVDKIKEMKSVLPTNPNTYLSDLFSRYVVELRAGRIK